MINVYAAISNLGYGIHAANMIKAIKEEGEKYNIQPIGQIQADPYFEEYIKEGMENRMEFDAKNPSLFIFHDEHSPQSCGSPQMTFSIFETNKLKPLSIETLKKGPADIVLTTTEKHKEILEANGIQKKIHVINEGIDDSLYNTIPYDAHVQTNKFTYLIVGKREERKFTDKTLSSWIKIMRDKDVALIIHSFNPFIHKDQKEHPFTNLACWTGEDPRVLGFNYKGFDGKAHHFKHGNCDIYFTTPTLSTSMMPSLYHSANIGISMSRGEGWDLPLCEMMACGLPCIATDCLGHSEYINGTPEIQQELISRITQEEIANDGIWFNGECGSWGCPSADDLEEKLVATYDNRDKYENKSEELANYMSETYNWHKSVKNLLSIIN